MNRPSDCAFAITVDGRRHETAIDPRSLLIDVVRGLGGKSARVGCHTGDCGACTLKLDGRLVKSCLVLAVSVRGSNVTTVAGSTGLVTACLQKAFIACKGFQCGYCTPGMILTAQDLLERTPTPTDNEIRHALLGNLCRCTGYDDIVRAVANAARQLMALRATQSSHGQASEGTKQ